MSAETLERSVLEGKDRDQLIAIATALGLKALSRAKKGDIIDRILEQTGSPNGDDRHGATNGAQPAADRADGAGGDPDGHEPLADWELELREQADDGEGRDDEEDEGEDSEDGDDTGAGSTRERSSGIQAGAGATGRPGPRFAPGAAGPETAEPYGDRGEGDGGGRSRRRTPPAPATAQGGRCRGGSPGR